jgi:Flp pilus assembly protein TadG
MRQSSKNSLLQSQSGLAAVEFAVVAPILLIIAFATSDLAGLVLHRMKTNQVVQEALLWAVKEESEYADITTFLNNQTITDVVFEFEHGLSCSEITCTDATICSETNPCEFVRIQANATYNYKFPLAQQIFGARTVYTETAVYQAK